MKKLCALCLCLIVFIPALGAVVDDFPLLTEVFANAGFEDVTALRPDDWGFYNNEVSLTTEKKKSGTYAVKIDTDSATANPYVRQVVSNVAPGATYRVTAWLNTETISGKGAVIKAEFYSNPEATPGNALGVDLTSDPFQPTDGVWKQVEMNFRAPVGCYGMRIFFRLLGAGTIYYDDVSCQITEQVPTHFLSTDEVFYYSDAQNGTATVTTNAAVYPSVNAGTVTIQIKNGTSVLWDKENLSLASGEVQCVFPLSKLTTLKKEYQLTAIVKDASGTALYTQTERISKYNRPQALMQDGTYQIDNQPFYPIFGYHVAKSQYARCAEAGVNVVQTQLYNSTPETIVASLDAIESYGLKALVALYVGLKPAGHATNAENTKAIVSLVKNHPAVFAYAIQDEPFLRSADLNDLYNSYKIIRDIDDVHPVYMVDRYKNTYHMGGKYTDILCIDPYPGNENDPHTYVADATKAAYSLFGDHKPIYVILQAFEYKSYWPTDNAFRNMQQQAFLEGAKGIGYYAFDEAYDGKLLPNNPLWSTLTQFYQTEAAYAFAGGTVIEEYMDAEYRYTLSRQGDKYYITVLNQDSKQKNVNIHAATLAGHAVSIISGAEMGDISLQNSTLRLTLAPSAAILLEAPVTQPLAFTNGLGVNVTKFSKGALTVKSNESAPNKSLVALYKDDGEVVRLVELYLLKEDTAIQIPDLSDGAYTLKGFVWDTQMRPVYNEILQISEGAAFCYSPLR